MTTTPTYEELQLKIKYLEIQLKTTRRIARGHQESEGWLDAVFTANPDPVIVFDDKEHTRHLNPAFTRVFGWTMDELMGHKVPFIPKKQVAVTDLKIRELYEDEKPVKFESKRLTRDGKLLDVLIHAAVIKDSKGDSRGIVMNMSDMTEKNKIETQHRQSHKNESIRTLTSGISSEFNNLFYAIYGNAELMNNDIRAEDKDSLDEIFNATKKGMDLIIQLQTSTHPPADIKNSQAVNLNFEIKRIYHDIKQAIPDLVEIDLDFADNLYSLSGDQEQIQKVILNLCFNAGDAMPDGGKLTVKTENFIIDDFFHARHPELKKGWCVKLTISDTGHGMNNAVRKRIFDPFYTTKDSGNSRGLGLSVISGIIKSHNGLSSCGSIPGVGTTFTIYLPAEIETESSYTAPVLSTAVSEKKRTILIVDDEQSVLDLIQKMVTSAGYNVITVNSGEKALIELKAKGISPDYFAQNLYDAACWLIKNVAQNEIINQNK